MKKKKIKAKVTPISEIRNRKGIEAKEADSDDLMLSSVENIRKAIGSIIWEGYLIERVLKEILTKVIPEEHIKRPKRLESKSINAMTLGILLSIFKESEINNPLVSRAFRWKDDRNDIVHNIQDIMVAHKADQSTPEGRHNFYSYLLGILDEAREIKIRFTALKLWHDRNVIGKMQQPNPDEFYGHLAKLFNELLPTAYEDFELAKFGL